MIRKGLLSTLLLIALSACNLVFTAPGNGSPGEPTMDSQVLIGQAVSQTYDAQTQIGQAVLQTLAAMATNTPEFTFTPSLTPTPTFTFTPEIPRVSVSVQTNCRSGPGTAYDVLGILNVGQTADLVGRSSTGDTWIIRLPSNSAITCWLWGQYATTTGNTSGLTVFTPPPTPTPPITFTLSYLQTVTCAGSYAFRFQLSNNGSLTWKSYRVDVTDATTSTSVSFSDDFFTDYTGCGGFVNQLQDLEHAESGVAGNWAGGLLAYNPAGHNISATFTLCSQDGNAGTCTSKSINFTP